MVEDKPSLLTLLVIAVLAAVVAFALPGLMQKLAGSESSTVHVIQGGLAALILCALAAVFVILTRRRYTERSQSHERYLAAILEGSADAIVGFDNNDVIQSWNKGAELMFGYTARETTGKTFYMLVPRDRLSAGELEHLAKQLREKGAVRNYETERLTKDGTKLTVELTRTAIRNEQGEIVGSSAIIRDISDRKRMARQLLQAENLAAIGELAASIAHEIKNPLAGINGAIQIIRDEFPEGHPRRAVMDEVIRQIHRSDKTVRDLLSFARPHPPTPIECDVHTVLTEAISLVEKEPQSQRVEIHRDFAEGLRPLWLDPQQMQHVFMNIILNAVQACSEGGRLAITTRGEDGAVEIDFADTGVGMSPEVLSKIFNPFFTTKPGGTGVGLSTARRIIEAHHGTIEAESEPHRGTTFTVRLQRKPPDESRTNSHS